MMGPDPCMVMGKTSGEMKSHNVTYRDNAASVMQKWLNAKPIELPFAAVSGVGLKNRPSGGRAQWCHLAHMVERLCALVCHQGRRCGVFSHYFGQSCC